MAVLTRHAKTRRKGRCGFNKSASDKMAQKAKEQGIGQADCNGSLGRYLAKLVLSHDFSCTNPIIYGEKIYLFSGDVLVTVMNLPNKYKNAGEN